MSGCRVGAGSGGECDRGSASVLVLGVALAALVLAGAVATLTQAAAAQARAAAAADTAALAAADVLAGRADGQPCDRASAVAAASGADLIGCDTNTDSATDTATDADQGAWSVRVQVSVRPAGPAGHLGLARASARSGPAVP